MAEGRSWEALLNYKNLELHKLKSEIENLKSGGVPAEEEEERIMEVIEKKEREKEEIRSAIRETAKIKEAREELEGIEKRGADEELLQPLREQLERHEEVAQKVLESAWGANIEKKEEQEAEPLLREGTSLDEMYIGKKANEIKEQFDVSKHNLLLTDAI